MADKGYSEQEETSLEETDRADIEEDDYSREPPPDTHTLRSNATSSSYVLAVFGFLIALLFLSVYFSRPQDSVSGSALLLGALVFGAAGLFLLLRGRPEPEHPSFEEVGVREREESQTRMVDSSLIEHIPVAQARRGPLGDVALQFDNLADHEEPFEEDVNDDEDEPGDEDDETGTPFEQLVQEALSTLPEDFQQRMENVFIRVQYEPGEEVLQRVGVKEGYYLLGLYEGVPLTAYGRGQSSHPDTITLYQRAIEEYCHHSPARIRRQVRKTVLHEAAHYFGIDHDEMPIWVR